MMRLRTRFGVVALVVSAALVLAACGDDEAADQATVSQTPPAQPVAPPQPPPDLPSVDGYLLSADERRIVLQMPDGEKRTFRVRPEDVPALGIPHLASHAGLTDVGFRVFYEQTGDRRYVKYAAEIPPPTPAG